MDYQKSKAPKTTTTHNLMNFCEETDNIYESVVIMSRRANQIAKEMKDDLERKLKEFENGKEEQGETFENPEQQEISRHYERLPKPSLIAADEFAHGRVYHRNPAKDQDRNDD